MAGVSGRLDDKQKGWHAGDDPESLISQNRYRYGGTKAPGF